MPGKTATISDLFSPMNSIKTCMEMQTKVISDGLTAINESILGCSNNISNNNALLKDLGKSISKSVVDSIKSLNEASQKQVVNTQSNDKLFNGITNAINNNFNSVKTSLDNIAFVVDNINKSNASINKTIVSGIEELNKNTKALSDSLKTQTTSSVGMIAGIASAVSEAFSTTSESFMEPLYGIGIQLNEITQLVKLIEEHVDPVKGIAYRMKNKMKTALNPFAVNEKEDNRNIFGKKNKINVPEVSGGKDAGELAKALADAAREIDKIGLVKSKLIKKKAENIIGGILDVFEKDGKKMTAAKMKENSAKINQLVIIAKDINSIASTMAKTLPIAPLANVGSKLSKKIIKNLLLAIEPLSKAKSIAKTKIAVENLKQIADNLLLFEAKMALTAVLGIPAVVGVGLAGLLIRESLFMFKPLSKKKTTANFAESAMNLKLISDALLAFEAKMALSVVFALPAMIGVGLANLLIRESIIITRPLSKTKTTKSMITAAANLALMANSIATFTASMALVSVLGIPAMIGLGMSALILKTSTWLFKSIGRKKTTVDIRMAALNLELMSLSMITFTLSVLATSMITKYMLTGGTKEFNPLNIVSVATSIGVFGLMLGSYAIYRKLGSGKSAKSVLTGALALTLMSASMILFTLAIATSYMITKAIIGDTLKDGKFDWKDGLAIISAVPIFGLMYGTYLVYRKLGKEKNVKNVINAGLAITMMSVGLITFAASLYVVHQISKSIIGDWDSKKDPGALIMDVAVLGLMLLSYGLYQRIGKDDSTRKVLNGGLAILTMSAGFVLFSAALYLSNTMIGDMWKKENDKLDFVAMLTSVGVLGLMFLSSLIFEGIGNNFANIAKGSAGVALMGLGLVVFGFGLGMLADVVKGASVGDLIAMPVLLGVFGIEFAAMGVLAGEIALGAAASLAMSVGLFVLSYSIGKYVDVVSDADWEDIGKMAALVGIFGGEFALLGIPVVAGAIVLGSASILTASAALLVFGKAMTNFIEPLKTIQITNVEDTLSLISSTGLAFAKLGIPVIAPFILAGAGAMVVAGKAIESLSKSLDEWGKTTITKEKMQLLCQSINDIKLAFQGDPDGNKKFGRKILDFVSAPFDLAAMRTTASALAIAGDSIKNLSKGIIEWQNANIDINAVDGIITIITKLRVAFGSIGSKDKSGNSLLKMIVGIDFSNFEMTDVNRGISSVRKMGKALIDISKGLLEYKDGVGVKFRNKADLEEFATSVANVVTSLSTAFASIVKDEKEGMKTVQSKVASTWFGQVWQDLTVNTFGGITTAEKGIKAVRHLGSTIKDIAEGLKGFKELVPNGKSSFIVDVAAGISALLQGIQEPLIAFGTTDETFTMVANKAANVSDKYGAALSSIHNISAQTINYEKHKVDVAAGLKNVGQIGELVKGLAEGVKILSNKNIVANLGKAGTISDDFIVSDDANGMIGNIQRLVCSQVAVFLQLGKRIQEVGIFDDIQSEVVQDVQKGLFRTTTTNKAVTVNKGKKSYLAIAVESTVGIGSVIKNLADGLKSMNDTFPTNDKMVDGISRVNRAITSIMSAFSAIGYSVMFGKPGESYDAIPKSMNDPEMSKKFGVIPGELGVMSMIGTQPYIDIANTIKTVTEGFNASIKSIIDNDSAIKSFVTNAESIMNSVNNLLAIQLMLSDHPVDFNVRTYIGKQERLYTMNAFNSTILDSAKTNTDKIKETVNVLTRFAPDLSKLTPKAGNSFIAFTESMNKGMSKLAASSTNIKHATKFVETLSSAVKNNVFDNISSNTQKITDSINSLDNDVFEPYAKMIAAFGTMTEKHDEFIKMQKELYELLKKIIDEINGMSGGSRSSESTQQTQAPVPQIPGSNSKQQPVIQKQQPQQLTAKLVPNKVPLEYSGFIQDLTDLLVKYKNNQLG